MNDKNSASGDSSASGPLSVRQEKNGLFVVTLGDNWKSPDVDRCLAKATRELKEAKKGGDLKFEGEGFDKSDGIVVSTILELIRAAKRRDLEVDLDSLPEKVRPLLKLSLAVPRRTPSGERQEGLVIRIGRQAVVVAQAARRFVEFLGELVYSFGKLLIGRSRFRKQDFWVTLQDCGVDALPIVSLLAILTGTILGFVGAVQLRKFGATIYMTDLVGLAMAREMAAIMTGVIMAGRTGAAFAAQIGSMNVNQEVDALETLGISPVEFLVLPRTLALILMMPLLTLYADVLGWMGGFLVAIPMNINAAEYWNQLIGSLGLGHILFGISKSFFFGIVVATTGCYYGLRSGRSSAAVGTATTRAVVAGITWIIVLDALFAFMDEALKG